MKFKVQSSKFKVQSLLQTLLFVLLTAYCSLLTVPAQNDLQQIENGGFVRNWLASNALPAEIDAGTWENFNRFNIENLPQKDWLAPFGGIRRVKPQIGTQKAGFKIDGRTNPEEKLSEPANIPLPEVGAASSTKVLADITEISWREYKTENARLDFYNLFGG
ncbi:MAG: hypothetical protein M3Q99_07375, partial [Acidobacteriota bacterium]|nr:hypothetical protein [Acidobacteriota bacterium]